MRKLLRAIDFVLLVADVALLAMSVKARYEALATEQAKVREEPVVETN